MCQAHVIMCTHSTMQTSNGVNTTPASSFGRQTRSRAQTAPSHTFGNRYKLDENMTKEGRPGPGEFDVPQSVGKQLQSSRPTQPAWRVGTGSRFSATKTVWKPEFESPGPGVCK
jgi:hypothetical protein